MPDPIQTMELQIARSRAALDERWSKALDMAWNDKVIESELRILKVHIAEFRRLCRIRADLIAGREPLEDAS